MNRVAIFGNTGAGKSTLAKQLAQLTNLPLHGLDKIKFRPGGEEIPHEDYLEIHQDLLQKPQWIIDGFGCVPSAWQRFAAADTLVYIDLPLYQHALWVTKRFIKGLFATPEGWPQGSPLLKSTLTSYKVLWLCHSKLTPRYRQLVANQASEKRVFHLRSKKAIRTFLAEMEALGSGDSS